MSTFTYKDNKITTIVMEIENTGADSYNINGVDLGKAIFLYRETQQTSKAIPLADYSVTVNGDQYLNINDGDVKDNADTFQVVYDEEIDSSQYNPIGDANIDTLVIKYNELQKDTVELWESVKNSNVKSDTTNQSLTLPLLAHGESWYWDEDFQEYRGIGVATVEVELNKVTEEGDYQVQRVVDTGDTYIAVQTSLKDETEDLRDQTQILRDETEVLHDGTQAIVDSIASQDAQITQNTIDIADLQDAVALCPFPINSVLPMMSNVNPDNYWVGTVWARIGDGRFIMGGATPNLTGGSKKITTDNMPSHNHSIDHNHDSATTSLDGDHWHHDQWAGMDTNGSGSDGPKGRVNDLGDNNPYSGIYYDTTNGDHTHTVNLPNYVGNSGSTGNGTDYLQPYITMCLWQRIS